MSEDEIMNVPQKVWVHSHQGEKSQVQEISVQETIHGGEEGGPGAVAIFIAQSLSLRTLNYFALFMV